MADKKVKFEKGNTPAGVAVFPRLDRPDYKFKKEIGEFSVKLRLSAEQTEPIREKLQAVLDQHVEAVKVEYAQKLKEAKTGKEKKAIKDFLEEMPINDLPIKEAVDDDGEPTGEFELSFKKPGNYKDKKTEKLKPLSVTHVDAAGKEVKGLQVWGGSIIRVGYTIRPYTTPKGVGVKLGLELVKVIKLVTGGGGANASDYGMDDEEEGYVADDMMSDETTSGTTGGDDADAEDNPDF